GFLGGDHDVAAGGQTHGAAEGRALHTTQGGAGQGVEAVHQRGELARVGQVALEIIFHHALHPVQVGTGGKALAFGAQHHHPHLALVSGVVEPGQVRVELGDQAVVEGVVHLGAVQRQPGDAALVDVELGIRCFRHNGSLCVIPVGDRLCRANRRVSALNEGNTYSLYIRNTQNLVSSTSEFIAAANESPSTSRVCVGSITPSSHCRALA